MDLPDQATIIGDKAYNNYGYEDLLEDVGLHLAPLRKKNYKRVLDPAMTYLMAKALKAIETTGSLIERLLPEHIHTVTATGFELKAGLFVVACSLNFVF